MDHARPLRRLLPVGVLTAAGLAGCATAPPYRPVMTSQSPTRPVATADSAASVPPPASAPVTANAGPAANGNPAANSSPVANGSPVAPAPPDAPPSSSPTPPPPVDLGQSPGVLPNPPGASGQTDLNLNAPMGVLQTPLASPPPSAAPTENAPPPPGTSAPASPLAAPPQVGVSVNIGAGNGAAAAPAPTQKPSAKNPPTPIAPPSPLARLRKRFHDLTHPSKPAPKKEGDTLSASVTPGTKTTTAITSDRFPLPTTNVGVALKVEMPPMHPLYVSDDVPRAQSVTGSVQTAQVEPLSPPANELPPIPPASTSVAAGAAPSAGIEQWPLGPGVTAGPVAATADSSEDFTAIPEEEYRAAVAKLERANEMSARSQSAVRPVPGPAALSEQARSLDPQPRPSTSAPGGTDTSSPAAQATTMIVIPQAAPSSQPLSQPLSDAMSAANSSPGPPGGALQRASLPNSNSPTQIPNQELGGAFPSGWSLPANGGLRPVTTTSATVVTPVAPQAGPELSSQPGEMPSGGNVSWVPIKQATPPVPHVSALPAGGTDQAAPPATPSAPSDGAQGGS
jgi:hypothetical protein